MGRLYESIHNEISVSIDNGYREYLITVVKSGQLKVEEENAGSVHIVISVAVRVALDSAESHILGVAFFAELALKANVLTAFYAGLRELVCGALIVKIEHGLVGTESVGNGLLNRLVMHSAKSVGGVKVSRRGVFGAHSRNNRSALKRYSVLACGGEIPGLGRSLNNALCVEIVDYTALVGYVVGNWVAERHKMQSGEHSSCEIIFLFRFSSAYLVYSSARAKLHTVFQSFFLRKIRFNNIISASREYLRP